MAYKRIQEYNCWGRNKINKSATLYHTIQGFIDMKQGKTEHNNDFKLRFDNLYKTMEIYGG